MKTNLLNAIALAIVMTTCYNCSVEPIDNSTSQLLEVPSVTILESQSAASCNGSNPKSRITNNGTQPLELQIFDGTGVLIDTAIDVQPNSVSTWFTFPEGATIFNVVINSHSDQKVMHVMNTCTELELQVDANNILIEATPQSSSN